LKRTRTKLLTPDDKIIKDMIVKYTKDRKPRKQYTKRIDLRAFCPYHPKTQLARLYLNHNQAMKLKAKFKSNFYYCKKCNDIFLVHITNNRPAIYGNDKGWTQVI